MSTHHPNREEIGAASAPSYINLIVQSGIRGYATGLLHLIMTSAIKDRRGAVLVELPSAKATGSVYRS